MPCARCQRPRGKLLHFWQKNRRCGEAPAGSREGPAAKIAACAHVSAHAHPKVSSIFGRAFFKKLARWSRGGSSLAAASESPLHGIFFSQSLFFWAFCFKRKGVEQSAQPPRLPPEGALQRTGIRLSRPRSRIVRDALSFSRLRRQRPPGGSLIKPSPAEKGDHRQVVDEEIILCTANI